MQIKTFKPADHKIKALVYGRSGSGKTMFGGSAPKPLIISAENGLLSLASTGLQVDSVEIKSLKDLKDALTWLKMTENQGKYETLVIDSISEINEIIKEELQTRLKRRMQLQDWGVLADEIKILLRAMKSLPMHVLYIAQEKDINDGDSIDKKVPMLNGNAATSICYDVDIVGYLEVQKDGSRVMITNAHPKLLTKDRSNCIGNDEEINFSVWCEKVKTVNVGVSKVVEDYTDGKNSNANQPRNDANVVDVPSTPNKKENAPEGKKNNDLQKQMHATWNEYVKLKKIDKVASDATRIATILKAYGKNSSLDMTEEEVKDFIKRVKVKIDELKKPPVPEAPAGIDAPVSAPTPVAEVPPTPAPELVDTADAASAVFEIMPEYNKNHPLVIEYMELYGMFEKEAIEAACAKWNMEHTAK